MAGLAAIGCASTTVHKDPGKFDKGLRFYRPKPYLMICPLDAAKWGNVGPDEMVEMKLEWLPDFAEEYSVRIRTGVGVNKTKVQLKDGWNLTNLDVDTDAKFKDNLDAITGLVKSVAPSGLIAAPKTAGKTTSSDDEAAAETSRPYRAVVRATNVPLGYYESVIARGPNGQKQLYGWRYVGFAPFAGCPTAPSGGDNCPCDPNQVYGMVFENGVMTFKLLSCIAAGGDTSQNRRAVAQPPAAVEKKDKPPAAPAVAPEDKVRTAVVAVLLDKVRGLGGFSPDSVVVSPKPIGTAAEVTIEVLVTPMTLIATKKSKEDILKVLEDNRPPIQAALGDGKTFKLAVTVKTE